MRLFCYSSLPLLVFSQTQGTVISNYGQVYNVSAPEFETDVNTNLKVVFDVGRTFSDSTKVNSLLNTAARYLNMHVDNGVPFEKLKVALVVHGAAAYDLLANAGYQKKYGVDNPNAPLIEALVQNEVQLILCGQTAAYRNIAKKDVLPGIQFSLSAMTALVQLQNKNFRLINF